MKRILFILIVAICVVACEQEGTNGHDPNIELDITCVVDTEFEHFTTVEIDPENYDTRSQEAPYRRFIVDLYSVQDDELVLAKRSVSFVAIDQEPMANAKFNVRAGKYKALVWCDYVNYRGEDWLYNTSDLRKILPTGVIAEDNEYKCAFSNAIEIDLSEAEGWSKHTRDVTLEATQGHLKYMATALPESIAASGKTITTVVTYTQYISAGYNVEEQKPNYFEPTSTFITKTKVDKENNVEFFHDYIFVNDSQTNIKLNFYLYDGEITINEDGEISGQMIYHTYALVAPIKRGQETLVEGRVNEM